MRFRAYDNSLTDGRRDFKLWDRGRSISTSISVGEITVLGVGEMVDTMGLFVHRLLDEPVGVDMLYNRNQKDSRIRRQEKCKLWREP